jgi:hypothetical protein
MAKHLPTQSFGKLQYVSHDLFRIIGGGGRQVPTPGIRALGFVAMIELRLQIAGFDEFTMDGLNLVRQNLLT